LDVCPELGFEDRHLYAAILEEIAGRIEAVRQLLLAPDAPMPNVELGALHLRKVHPPWIRASTTKTKHSPTQ
jgi:hypothetical protein